MNTPRQLPIVEKDGASWYLDARLLQARRVDNPHKFISFSDEEEMEDWIPE